MLLAAVLCALLAWHVLPRLVPLPEVLLKPQPSGAVYLAADGTPLRQLLNEDGQRVASLVPYEKLPEAWIDATLAAEDRRFFSHGGIDLLAVARAAVGNVKSGRIVSGGSTLTQQLIKISRKAEGGRTWGAKIEEALQARHLEMTWSKPQILTAYASRVSFGNLFTGLGAASEGYFHKPVSDLTLSECAFLAALPQAPGRLNPFRDSAPAVKRQQWVLQRMRDLKMVDREAYEMASGQPLRLQRFLGGFDAPHAVSLLQAQGAAKGTVRTTLDAGLQQRVENIISARLSGLRERHVDHAAAVVIENASGKVLAWAGSRDFFSEDGGQINGAWVPHSPGSALKPFTYALAFGRGDTPASIVADLPVAYQTPTGQYVPENYDLKYYGPMTYRYALGNSLNVSAVRVLERSGGAEKLLALLQQLGLSTLTEPAGHYGLGLTIGNAPVRLIELANAYATLARLGVMKPWTLVQPAVQPAETRVLDEKVCYWLADILSDNQARALTFGPRSPLRLDFKAAAKTGTSTSYRDNWTLGYTPQYTVGVWAGNFTGQPMEGVSGVTGAGPIFKDIFIALNARVRQTWFPAPPDLTRVRIDTMLGKCLAQSGPVSRMSREEIFFGQKLPPYATPGDYELGTGRTILAPEYAEWIESKDNWLGNQVVASVDPARAVLRITSPPHGLRIRLDPDLPDGRRLLLKAQAPGLVRWRCNTLTITQRGTQTFAQLVPGSHEITAEAGGRSVRVSIIVE